MMQTRHHRRLRQAIVLGIACACFATAQPADAQFPGRGGRGGFSGGERNSLLAAAGRDTVQTELGLTDDQKQKIAEIAAQARPDREALQPFLDRLQAAETDEEQQAIRDEMQQMFQTARQKSEAELEQLLKPEQFARLRQLALQDEGPQAIAGDELAAELKLTDEQKTQFEKLREERWTAQRALGFRASEEQRQKFREEWDAKTLDLLTPQQRELWQAKIGPPLAAANSAAGTPATPASPAPPQRTTPPVAGSTEVQPDGAPAEKDVVASFGRQAEAAPSAEDAARPHATAKTISFNFRYAPWGDVLKLFADAAGLTLDLNDVPPGTFNYYDPNQYTPTEALDILNGYLLQKGYILVRRNNFLVALNIDNGIPPNLVPYVSLEELPRRGKNELLSVVIPLQGVEAEQAAKEVQQLLGPQGKVVPLTSANSVVVTDVGSNLLRVQRLLAGATKPEDPEALQFRSFQVRHIPATDAERHVRNLLGLASVVPNVSSANEPRSFSFRGRGRGRGDDNRERSTPPPTPAAPTNKAQVTSDARTNRLLVAATAAQLAMIEELLVVIDIGEGADGLPIAFEDKGPQLRVYNLDDSDPREVSKTLNALMPGVVVNEDGRNDRIHIYATPAEHREIELLIRQLDGAGGGQSVAVLPLSQIDAVGAMSMLRSLFAAEGNDAPAIEADAFGQRLMIRGTTDQIAQVKTLLAQLGEDGTGLAAANARPRGPVRSISLGGRDPEEFLPLLERMWNASGQRPIRMVVPSAPNPVRDRRIPSADDRQFDNRSATPARSSDGSVPLEAETDRRTSGRQRPAHPLREDHTFLTLIRSAPTADSNAPTTATPQAAEAETPQAETTESTRPAAPAQPDDPAANPSPPARRGTSAPVAITLSGGNLILSSEDEEALDRLEQMIQTLSSAIPPRTTWTVFYLRSADASETALMLDQLFPSSSIGASTYGSGGSGLFGGLTSGISSFGSSLMDATGLAGLGQGPLALRIIPEIRSNALFVAGPTAQVREVEQMLEILDASELPESLRDRVPRMIPVDYADVAEVANIVREVYKDSLGDTNGNSSRRGGNNPLAMLMGGGNDDGDRRRGNRQPSEVRLTIGVDTRTSQLVVSANDSMFQQIEALVEQLDQAAYEAKRTVRVIEIDRANSAIIQQALGSVMPKVKVSTTGGQPATQPARAAPTPSTSEGSSEDASRDQMRRFFEQRMMERMQQRPSDDGRRSGARSFGGNRGAGSFDRSRSEGRGSSRRGGRGR